MLKNGLWRQIVWSSYDLEYYRWVRVRPWFEAFRYWLAFSLLLAAVFAVVFGPAAFSLPAQAVSFLEKLPAGSYVAVKSGRIETDLPQPTKWGSGDAVVVVDTSLEGSEWKETVPAGAMIIGRNAIFFDQNGGQRVLSATDLSDFSLSRETALDWWKKYGSGFGFAAVLVMFVAYFFALLIANGLLALLGAVAVLTVGRLWRLRLGFGQWLAVGLHAVTLPALAGSLFGLIGLNAPAVRTVVFFMFMAAVAIDERSNPTSTGAADHDRTPAGKHHRGRPRQ